MDIAIGSINWDWLLFGREGTLLHVALTVIGCNFLHFVVFRQSQVIWPPRESRIGWSILFYLEHNVSPGEYRFTWSIIFHLENTVLP